MAAVRDERCEVNRRVSGGSLSGLPNNYTMLTYAFVEEKFKAAKALIECPRVDCTVEDSNRNSPAYWAGFMGHIPCLEALKARGVNLRDKCSYGSAPLHGALFNDHKEAAEWLLDEGDADPHSRNSDDWTPLHIASLGDKCLDIAARLTVCYNADIHAKSNVCNLY